MVPTITTTFRSTWWMRLKWHENRLQAPAPRFVIVFFHFVSMQSRSVRKPPLAERTLVGCLPRTILSKRSAVPIKIPHS